MAVQIKSGSPRFELVHHLTAAVSSPAIPPTTADSSRRIRNATLICKVDPLQTLIVSVVIEFGMKVLRGDSGGRTVMLSTMVVLRHCNLAAHRASTVHLKLTL